MTISGTGMLNNFRMWCQQATPATDLKPCVEDPAEVQGLGGVGYYKGLWGLHRVYS